MWLNRTANKLEHQKHLLVSKTITFPLGLVLIFLDIPSYANSYLKEIAPPQYLPQEAQWCLPVGECLLLEVADTVNEKKLGLMNRGSMPRGSGMWFKFAPSQIVRFWMYKTLIPLDMVFFFKGVVIELETNIQPCYISPCISYGPNKLVDGVVELAAGEVNRLNIRVGDTVDIQDNLTITSKERK